MKNNWITIAVIGFVIGFLCVWGWMAVAQGRSTPEPATHCYVIADQDRG
jgi:hypothetical protein